MQAASRRATSRWSGTTRRAPRPLDSVASAATARHRGQSSPGRADQTARAAPPRRSASRKAGPVSYASHGPDDAGPAEVGSGEVGSGEVVGEAGSGEVGSGEVGSGEVGSGEVGRARWGRVRWGRVKPNRATPQDRLPAVARLLPRPPPGHAAGVRQAAARRRAFPRTCRRRAGPAGPPRAPGRVRTRPPGGGEQAARGAPTPLPGRARSRRGPAPRTAPGPGSQVRRPRAVARERGSRRDGRDGRAGRRPRPARRGAPEPVPVLVSAGCGAPWTAPARAGPSRPPRSCPQARAWCPHERRPGTSPGRRCVERVDQPAQPRPAALRRSAARSVRSQVNSGSSRPKWPYAAVLT